MAPRVCQISAAEDCSSLWSAFTPPQASAESAVVILTFDGDGYFAGARAAIASALAAAHGPLLFAVASASHASLTAEWFAGLQLEAAHALCSVDPRALPDVEARARELSGYSRPEHHQGWSSVSAALYRVFLRKLFPLAQRAVYVDADVIIQTDVASVVAKLSEPLALPISAARSANTLRLRMDFCCKASKKVSKLLQNTSELESAADVELLQEFQEMPQTYHEFNNGVMALDLLAVEENGVFQRLEQWLQLNVKFGLFDNDQHAWNLAASQQWQDLQESHRQNAPSLDMLEAVLSESKPSARLQEQLRGLAFVHYTNRPKPWEVDWSRVSASVLFDDGIWREAFGKSGGQLTDLRASLAPSVRETSAGVRLLRPEVSAEEHLELGLLYMEGTGGLGKDLSEARWRIEQAAGAGVAQAVFMRDRGLAEEVRLSDTQRLTKLEVCWALAAQRIKSHEDHQTLQAIYGMTDQEYQARKVPVIAPSCYWRLSAAEARRGSQSRSAAELDALFKPSDGWSTPALPPRLSKWLELVGRDYANKTSSTSAGSTSAGGESVAQGKNFTAPVQLGQSAGKLLLLPALGAIGLVVGGLVWKILQLQNRGRDRKDKKKGKKRA